MEEEKFILGYISPDGDKYPCEYTSHAAVAKYLSNKYYNGEGESVLLKNGWIKVIDSWDSETRTHGQFVYCVKRKITKKQADCLFDLGLYDNYEVRDKL